MQPQSRTGINETINGIRRARHCCRSLQRQRSINTGHSRYRAAQEHAIQDDRPRAWRSRHNRDWCSAAADDVLHATAVLEVLASSLISPAHMYSPAAVRKRCLRVTNGKNLALVRAVCSFPLAQPPSRSQILGSPLASGVVMGKRDPRVDAYIKNAPEFAKPILEHLRAVVHAVHALEPYPSV